MTTCLSPAEAKAFYDRFGARQDNQGFYEDVAFEALIRFSDFVSAQRVFELGCGTGKLAHRLLSEKLPEDAVYVGVDVSSTMNGNDDKKGTGTFDLSETKREKRYLSPFLLKAALF